MISNGPGVSLLAASLPGVQLLPFHVKEPALPSFTAEQWKELLQRPSQSTDGSSSNEAQQQNAAILLSSPHFVDVEKFLLRLSAALPGMPVGGWLGVLPAGVSCFVAAACEHLDRHAWVLGCAVASSLLLYG